MYKMLLSVRFQDGDNEPIEVAEMITESYTDNLRMNAFAEVAATLSSRARQTVVSFDGEEILNEMRELGML